MSAANIIIPTVQKKLNETFIQLFAKSIIKHSKVDSIHFSKLSTHEEWLLLGKFRRKVYQARKPYMMAELHEDGKDRFDAHGYVYFAWLHNEIIASVRLCPHPFETEQLLQPDQLKSLLGKDYRETYLEWTRLLISPEIKMPYLLNALIVYAGMQTLANSNYQHYFGYSTLLVRRLFRNFKLSNTDFNFSIPRRGTHQYVLFKGNFLQDMHYLMNSKNQQEAYL
jgi:hypothetical protein